MGQAEGGIMIDKTLVEQLHEVGNDIREECLISCSIGFTGKDDCHGRTCRSCFEAIIHNIADRIEAEYMELPKDADGVPCKRGDHVRFGETEGDIKEMLLFERGWELYLTSLDDSVSADSVHHVKPDTPASIASDIDNGRCTGTEAVERFKALGGEQV